MPILHRDKAILPGEFLVQKSQINRAVRVKSIRCRIEREPSIPRRPFHAQRHEASKRQQRNRHKSIPTQVQRLNKTANSHFGHFADFLKNVSAAISAFAQILASHAGAEWGTDITRRRFLCLTPTGPRRDRLDPNDYVCRFSSPDGNT
jgi:hypothetical protein